MGISFLKKSDFHLSNGVFPILCYEISATGDGTGWKISHGAWNKNSGCRGVSFLSVYLFSVLWWLAAEQSETKFPAVSRRQTR
jgi:hypothetical protein